MSGAYRRLVTRPIDMSWSFQRYDGPFDDLILSDLDEMRGVVLKDAPEGQYKALVLQLSLPASCYATMALRELLKADTSAGNQALQNNYHKKPGEETSDAKGEEASEEAVGEESQDKGEEKEGEAENSAKRKLDSENGDAKRAKQVQE